MKLKKGDIVFIKSDNYYKSYAKFGYVFNEIYIYPNGSHVHIVDQNGKYLENIYNKEQELFFDVIKNIEGSHINYNFMIKVLFNKENIEEYNVIIRKNKIKSILKEY